MRAAAFLLRRHRHELGPMLLLALVVFLTAFLAALAPRLFNRVADAGLRHEVSSASSIERNLELGEVGSLRGGSGLDSVAQRGPRLEAELPDSVRQLVVDRSHLAESANWSVIEPPAEQPSFLRFRFQDGIDGRIEYLEGRAPTGDVSTAPGREGTLPGEPEDATVFEVALSVATAEALQVSVGDRLELVPDVGDPLVGQFSSPERAAADIVGIFDIVDPADDWWLNDTALERPSVIVVDISTRLFYATGLLAPEAYGPLIEKDLPARYAWRYYIDPQRMDAGMVETLSDDLRQMESRYPPFVTSLSNAGVTTMQTALLDLVGGFGAERRTAEAVLVTAALGPLGVATASVALLALLIVHRRRPAIALTRGRGASVGQLLGTHLLEGLLLALPPAAAAYLAAVTLVEARGTPSSALVAGLVAAGATLVLVLTVARPASAPLRQLEREAPTPVRASPRRLSFELLVIVLALGGAFLLRQRGLAGGSTAGELAGVDPLLAAVPALIGLAVGIVAVRLYPFPVRLAGWFADGWRGIVPALGLRRAARTGDVGSLPLVVLLVTVAIGAFSSTMFLTIERGQAAAAWQEVGADAVIDPGTLPFPSEFDATQLDAVEEAAAVHVDVVALGGRGGARVELHALDTAAYQRVARGTPADPSLPESLIETPQEPGPVPAILSPAAASSGIDRISVGDEVDAVISSRDARIRVVEIRPSVAGVDPGDAWILVPLDALRTHIPERAFAPSIVYVRAPGAEPAALRAELAEALPGAGLTFQAEVLAELREGPLVTGVGIGFVIAVSVAIVYAALATTVAFVLIAALRSRETAHLRTLGMTRGAIVALAVVEHGPAVLAAVVVGVALGIGVAWFVAPGLGLAGLIGSSIEVSLQVDWLVVGLLLGALVLIIAVAIGLSSWIGRRASLAGSVRQGIE